jgi:hypothetical protein
MIIKTARLIFLALAAAIISGCAGTGLGFSITEQDMTRYLEKSAGIEQSVGVENVMFARIAVDDLKVTIGRADADRISVFANTTAMVQMLTMQEAELDLDVEFSAIPEYNQETGEVFMKSLRLEQFAEQSGKLTPEITKLLKPAVALIGQTLSTYPVYKLDENKIEQALLKSTNPKLVIQGHSLVVDTFE